MTEVTLFETALAKESPAERSAFLDVACGTDVVLRRRVEALLQAHERAGNFLNRPVPEQIRADRVTQTQDEKCPRDADGVALDFLSPSEKPTSLGRLRNYEVLEVIGKGGFGTVFRAFDEKLHRVVAIKVLARELAANATARKRFLREARAAAAVPHEHVIATHDVEEEPTPYLVIEYVAGQTLQAKIDATGPLGVAEILRIGMQTARGLAAAHAQGLVHRDVKPANILLENGIERVKLTDFGLARAVDDASVTQSGVIAGTPLYMSPEQAAGEVVDARSDLFSLGSVLYAMSTGRPPFRASGVMAVMKRVMEDAPRPVREVNPDILDWLEAIIAKLLAKKPQDRFQSAREVAELLEQHLAHLRQPTTVPMPAPVEVPRQERQPSVIRVRATATGRYVLRAELLRGRLVDAGWMESFFPTVTLTNVITDLCALAEDLDSDYQIVVKQPNAWTTASLDLMIVGTAFEIACARQLVRGGFPFNPLAAEFGSNYDVVVTLTKASSEVQTRVIELLRSRYTCSGEPHPPDVAESSSPPTSVDQPTLQHRSRRTRRVIEVVGSVLLLLLVVVMVVRLTWVGTRLGETFFYHQVKLSADEPNVIVQVWNTSDEMETTNRISFRLEGPDYSEPYRTTLITGEKTLRLPSGSYWMIARRDGKQVYRKLLRVGWRGVTEIHIPTRPVEAEQGWSPLFDGRTLDQWTESSPTGTWKLANATLTGEGKGTLLSKHQRYSNFHLRAEVRINEGGLGHLLLRSTKKGLSANRCAYEVYINPTNQQLPRTGSLEDPTNNFAYGKDPLIPPNSWFTLESIVQGNRILTKVNGQTVLDWKDLSNQVSTGAIGLRVTDPKTKLEFRKIEIKELPSSSSR
jgi:hypothetical protein